jgi:hypothetical protein
VAFDVGDNPAYARSLVVARRVEQPTAPAEASTGTNRSQLDDGVDLLPIAKGVLVKRSDRPGICQQV